MSRSRRGPPSRNDIAIYTTTQSPEPPKLSVSMGIESSGTRINPESLESEITKACEANKSMNTGGF